MRWCIACGFGKELSGFSRSTHLPGGYMFECKDCRRAASVAKSRESLEKLERKIAQASEVVRGKSAKPSARALEEAQARNYVAAARVTTRCGQCNQLGVEFYHPAPDRTGKLLVAGFVSMGEIDSRIDDMVPLCTICKPLIEKGKLKTHLFD